MVEAKDLGSWREFEDEVRALRERFEGDFLHQKLLFRGQGDSKFRLETTLEREGCPDMPLDEYYRLTDRRVRPAVETFTGVTWDVPEYTDALRMSFHSDEDLLDTLEFPSEGFYRYMVYLRHHGFPSPLLDWTYSPYVAAFFAFRNDSKSPMRSIYVYYQLALGGAVGAPTINAIGPYVRSHRRHFRQQSNYTICTAFVPKMGWRFHPHEAAAEDQERGAKVWKFNIPSKERHDVLKRLNEYNLNAFSLFDSEESLLETMWFREFVLRIPQ